MVVWEHRRLIRSMVRRDILSRYQGSFAGALWTFINPLLLMLTYAFVFGVVMQSRFPGDSSKSGFFLYLLAGLLPWWAFSEAVGRSPHVILEHRNFVKKLRFPLETLPVNLVLAGLVTEAIGLGVFLIGIGVIRHTLPTQIGWLAAILVPQVALTAGLCWFLSALGVYMRDLSQIMGFVLNLWFYLTPICYPESQLPANALGVLRWNPMLPLVRAYRDVLLENRAPDMIGLGIWFIGAVVLAILAFVWFQRLRRRFADIV